MLLIHSQAAKLILSKILVDFYPCTPLHNGEKIINPSNDESLYIDE